MEPLIYWVWLTTLKGLNDACRHRLLAHFGSPENIYLADARTLSQVGGLTAGQVRALENKATDAARRILDTCSRKNIFILTMHDARYPQRLRNIFEPPLLLYGRGELPLFDEEVAVAVVGTRFCTDYGLRMAEQFGFDLSRQGALVVSGLAAGVDAAAHRGALRAGRATAAVVGCGVDVVYPAENGRLYEDIAASGVILPEYPPQTPPARWRFPARNRILSGLSLAALVVEAPEKSGALITAAAAAEQGRDVFALPGRLDAESCRGSNCLLRDGASLATESWDILGEYQHRYPHKLHRDGQPLPSHGSGDASPVGGAEKPQKQKESSALPVIDIGRNAEGLSGDEIMVLRLLDSEAPMLTDDIAQEAGVPVQQVLAAVTMLEIEGFIRREGLRKFVRTVELKDTKE